jgi:hypothetical protein
MRRIFFMAVAIACAAPAAYTQSAPPSFTLEQVMSYPFPENLIAATNAGSAISTSRMRRTLRRDK